MADENVKKEKGGVASEKKVSSASKSAIALREEEILAFWNEKRIFAKTLAKNAPHGEFTFYDGPPFATGLPHYGHILAGTIKDVIPRYKTMQGFHVARRWGWDCHGLPIENLIEKELGLKGKKDIEEYGIEKFNKAARESVLRYYGDWKKIIPRLGRFVDMDNFYMTMDSTYTESVWWSFKQLWDKKLAYEGYKSMHLCPHCGTTLANFEVNQGYKDITDISVYVKFQLRDEKGNDVPNTFLLAWTTTPWTLPGNFALAINPEIDYVQVSLVEEKADEKIGTKLILAENRLAILKQEYTIEKKFKGSELVGKSYQPLFKYYENAELKNKQNAWRVYAGDFVTTVDGTGIVHIAPGFGEDDLRLSQEQNIPFIQHVGTDGKFKKEVTDFAGQDVKPKGVNPGDHQKADIEIIKYLAGQGSLFAKEKIIHSYPHCWRCETPLLNYATSSWFVKVTDLKDRLVKENKKINWVPQAVGEARFGNWLEGAKDWGVSRQRYWGTPMPIWKDTVTGEYKVIGSIADLRALSRSKNTYYVIRHGEAENNLKNVWSINPANQHHLTEKGKTQVANGAKNLAKMLGGKPVDFIFTSSLVRTKETAEIVRAELGLSSGKVVIDNRLHELNAGVWEGKNFNDFVKVFPHTIVRFEKTPEGGENYSDVKKRVADMLYDLESKYAGKTIVLVSHEAPIFLLTAAVLGLSRQEAIDLRGENDFIANGESRALDFVPMPHNEEYELDLHRPYIDDLRLVTSDGHALVRVLDIFDTWYDSGSMPYASNHFPFESGQKKGGLFSLTKPIAYPADFIAEGLDQTRGWFYTLLVLGTALFKKSPYKNVVVNGLILAEDGKKMSKSLKNYPEVMPTVDKYSADALRYFLMASPAVKAEEVCFSEKSVDEVVKKVLMRLNNIYAFYALYADGGVAHSASKNILDRWIIARLTQTGKTMTSALEAYELDKATRQIDEFIEDFSTWYLRRSRERFKGDDVGDKSAALSTMRYVLREFATLCAPFVPFAAEDIYQKVKTADEPESVHLRDWPVFKKYDAKLLAEMITVRKVVEQALSERAKAGIKVRQPLASLKVKAKIGEELLDILADEVNVKKVLVDATISGNVELDVKMSPELIEEGKLRELIRALQAIRKDLKFNPNDKAKMEYDGDDAAAAFVKKFSDEIVKKVNLAVKPSLIPATPGSVAVADDIKITVRLQKL